MQYIWTLEQLHLHNAWLAIGTYDGVHLGHQAILQEMVAGASRLGVPAVVLTFHPHPKIVLRGSTGPLYLTLPEERARIITSLGVDYTVLHAFDRQVAAMSAKEFMLRMKTHFQLSQLWVGYDFALGRQREGDLTRLRELGEELGYLVHVRSPLSINDQIVSSSKIRELISAGEVQQAARLLGRAYSIHGPVIDGDGRGKRIGIPTANIRVDSEKIIPGNGVYACRAWIGGNQWAAATNIGIRPTFDQQGLMPHIEAHLLDYQGDLYGNQIQLEFIARLRGEKRFPDVEALIQQIRDDIQHTRQIYNAAEH
jgi:riboflavin kinase/FMN adenylyltransferase